MCKNSWKNFELLIVLLRSIYCLRYIRVVVIVVVIFSICVSYLLALVVVVVVVVFYVSFCT